jgi:hypothetical protein
VRNDGRDEYACGIGSCTAPAINSRTRRCEFHQRQYEQASSHHSTLLNRHPNPKDPKHPGDKAAFIAARYTEHPDVYTWLSPTDRGALQKLLNDAVRQDTAIRSTQRRMLQKFATVEEVGLALDIYLKWVDRLLMELQVIASEPGDVEEALNGAPKAPKPAIKKTAAKKASATKPATKTTAAPSAKKTPAPAKQPAGKTVSPSTGKKPAPAKTSPASNPDRTP